MDEIYKKIQKLGEIFLALGTISFVYYFIGFLYSSAYFASLGISVRFLDFSYQNYVIDGIINTVVLMSFLPFFIDWYMIYSTICEKQNFIINTNKELEKIENELKKNNESYLIRKDQIDNFKIEITESTKQLNEYKKIFLTKNPFSINFIGNRILFFLYLLFITLFYFINRPSLVAILIQGFVGIALSLFTFNYIRSIVIGSKKIKIMFVWFLSFIMIFAFPFFSGYLNGYADGKQDTFRKINIKIQDETLCDVYLVNFGRNFIILKKDNNIIYIPESEIKKIESSD